LNKSNKGEKKDFEEVKAKAKEIYGRGDREQKDWQRKKLQ
jgi:hypothetical protein